MGNIYLIRHAFTPSNNASYNNQENLRSIAEDPFMPIEKIYGTKQARELGKFLKTIKGNNLVIASPFKRVQETLNIALKEMGYECEIIIDNELKEKYSAIHYGRTVGEMLRLYPESKRFYEELAADPLNTRFIGGESDIDVRDRTVEVSKRIKKIYDSGKYDNIFVFAHGTVNRWIYYHINNYLSEHNQKNCEVILATGPDKGKIVFTPVTTVPKGFMVNIDDYK